MLKQVKICREKLPYGSLKSCARSSDTFPVNLHQILQLSPAIPPYSPSSPRSTFSQVPPDSPAVAPPSFPRFSSSCPIEFPQILQQLPHRVPVHRLSSSSPQTLQFPPSPSVRKHSRALSRVLTISFPGIFSIFPPIFQSSLQVTNSSPVDRKPSTDIHLFFYLIPDTSDQRQPTMSLHLKDVPHLFFRTSNQRQPTTVAAFKQTIEAPHIWTSVTISDPL